MSAPRLLAPTTISGGVPTAGAGTLNTIALWTPDGNTLGNSLLTQSGNIVTNASGAIRALGTTQTSPAFTRHDTTTSGIYFPATNEIGFTISNQHAMFISSGRNVGIGTVSPSTRLHVSDNSSIPMIVQSSGSTDSYLRFINTSNNLGYIGYVGTSLYLAPNNGAGNVGVGTASPGFKFVVADTVAGVVTSEIRNDSTNSAATARLRFTTQGGESWIEAFRNAGGALTFATLSTERARIDSSGNVGIGTSANIAGARVAITGGALPSGSPLLGTLYMSGSLSSGRLCPALSSGTDLSVVNTFFDSSNLEISAGTTPAWTSGIVVSARSSNSATTADTVTLYTQGTRRVAVGTTSMDASITPNYGLKLPATPGNADAQTLDCYQENPLATTAGNGWTPTIGGTAAQWGGTLPTVSFARYVQIGSIVFCDVRLTSASIQSTYGVTTITPPPPAQNAFATEVVVPASTTSGGVTGNGAQFGGVVYLPTLAASTAIRLTWFYFTTS